MELGILVGHIRGELAKHKKLMIEPQSSHGKEYYADLETQKTFSELGLVVKQLEAFNPSQEATLDHVKIITDFFEKRWERIKGTDSIINFRPDSSANVLCVYIAKYLSEQRDLVMQRNYMALLQPTIKVWHNDASHTDLWTLYPHNYLPTDDNESCIQMGYVDLSMDEDNDGLVMSYVVGTERRYLSNEEADRVYNHSPLISDYYDLMKRHHQKQDNSRKTQEAIQRTRDQMVKALRDEQYGKRSVQSSYGAAGLALLRANLLKDVNNLFETREQLFDFMSAELKPEEWKGFLAKMDDNQKLIQLILRGESIDAALGSHTLFKSSDQYNKVVSVCLLEAYWRGRNAGSEYNSYIGSFLKWPKGVKGNAVDKIRKAIIGLTDPACEDKKFLLAGNNTDVEANSFTQDERDLLAAMKDGDVGKIYKRVCELLLPSVVENDVTLKGGLSPQSK